MEQIDLQVGPGTAGSSTVETCSHSGLKPCETSVFPVVRYAGMLKTRGHPVSTGYVNT